MSGRTGVEVLWEGVTQMLIILTRGCLFINTLLKLNYSSCLFLSNLLYYAYLDCFNSYNHSCCRVWVIQSAQTHLDCIQTVIRCMLDNKPRVCLPLSYSPPSFLFPIPFLSPFIPLLLYLCLSNFTLLLALVVILRRVRVN